MCRDSRPGFQKRAAGTADEEEKATSLGKEVTGAEGRGQAMGRWGEMNQEVCETVKKSSLFWLVWV